MPVSLIYFTDELYAKSGGMSRVFFDYDGFSKREVDVLKNKNLGLCCGDTLGRWVPAPAGLMLD